MYNLDFFRWFSLMGTTLCAAPNNLYAISTNYHVYIYFNAHMIYMYTYFVLTSINSCFIHIQQHAPPWIAGVGHPCSDRSLFVNVVNWYPKITFDRISYHFIFIFVKKIYKVAAGGHFGCLNITFDRISGHFRMNFGQNGRRRPFWMSEIHFRSHFRPFHIDTEFVFKIFWCPKTTFDRTSGYFRSIRNFFLNKFWPIDIDWQLNLSAITVMSSIIWNVLIKLTLYKFCTCNDSRPIY